MSRFIAIVAAVLALHAPADSQPSPAQKRMMNVYSSIVTLEQLAKEDKHGLVREYLDSTYRLATGGDQEIELAIQQAISDFIDNSSKFKPELRAKCLAHLKDQLALDRKCRDTHADVDAKFQSVMRSYATSSPSLLATNATNLHTILKSHFNLIDTARTRRRAIWLPAK